MCVCVTLDFLCFSGPAVTPLAHSLTIAAEMFAERMNPLFDNESLASGAPHDDSGALPSDELLHHEAPEESSA